jgi:hypothetical protein
MGIVSIVSLLGILSSLRIAHPRSAGVALG